MILRIAALGIVLLASAAVAYDDDASRAKLIGTWQSADAGKDSQTWSFQEKDDKGNVIHVTNVAGPKTMLDYDCDSFGHDCMVKDNGHPAKVSLNYNGPKLVQWETRGTYVCKRAFLVTGDGDTMDMVQETLAPTAKSETVHFKRVPAGGTH